MLPERSKRTDGNPEELLAYPYQRKPNQLPQHCDNISENQKSGTFHTFTNFLPGDIWSGSGREIGERVGRP
jgi:hypothetical protein